MVLLFYVMELFQLLQIGELSKKSLQQVRPILPINRNCIGM